MENIKKFFENDSTEKIAQKLLGKRIIYHGKNGDVSCFIVETEAYLGVIDEATHSYRGLKTKRSLALFKAPATIYVFTIWGGRNFLNFITQKPGIPEGVLIRAVEPECGVKLMAKNRKQKGFSLTNGPGNLTEALGIDLNLKLVNHSNLNLDLDQFKIPQKIIATPRIGVPHKEKWTQAKLRYAVKGNPYVSKMRKNDMNFDTYGWK